MSENDKMNDKINELEKSILSEIRKFNMIPFQNWYTKPEKSIYYR